MDGSLKQRVGHQVDTWLRWVPRWQPGTHRARAKLCRTCFGSPVIAAAGLTTDVPHAVQHALAMRMKLVVEACVDEYTAQNLPLLARELARGEEGGSPRTFRPHDGLEPEFSGLDLDPPPVDDAPYLFTFAELADADLAGSELGEHEDPPPPVPEPAPPLSVREKAAIRAELAQADAYAARIGGALCSELVHHRERLRAAVSEFVEPQVQALLADLESSLDSPRWPRD